MHVCGVGRGVPGLVCCVYNNIRTKDVPVQGLREKGMVMTCKL